MTDGVCSMYTPASMFLSWAAEVKFADVMSALARSTTVLCTATFCTFVREFSPSFPENTPRFKLDSDGLTSRWLWWELR